MRSFLNLISKIIIISCIAIGSILIYNSEQEKKNFQIENVNSKAITLKKYLLRFNRPQKVEIFNLTERLKADVEEIKKISLPLDPNSQFYVSIDLFTDENDSQAPLIAQVKFFEISTNNKLKEENLNLE